MSTVRMKSGTAQSTGLSKGQIFCLLTGVIFSTMLVRLSRVKSPPFLNQRLRTISLGDNLPTSL
ncbi:MAG: hypothetical protein ABJA67_12795 [Chthonomonadales bacterium]